LAGIYIHIPFCRQACHYCDFHFSTNTSLKSQMVKMICKELELQKSYLGEESVRTIYFGGGTPSLLEIVELDEILNTICQNYRLELEELTIEANPDDLHPQKLRSLKQMGFDRLSIGIQSFDDRVLKFYNRTHTAEESFAAIDKAKQAGFSKLSIDLMYGFPQPDHELWKRDLLTAIRLDPGHISSYALTVEPDTALGRWVEKGRFVPASEDFIAEQFEMMQAELGRAGYIQYEISNFGRPGAFAVHNTNYWMGVPYLGIGPSAHSFDGKNRQHNPSNNIKYIKALEKGYLDFEFEEMEATDALNEYLLTSLRTMWGADLDYIRAKYQKDVSKEKREEISRLEKGGWLEVKEERLILTAKGKLLADALALKLFL
jgi:oxygen-independent coproporphyrinogen-3 oxidase